MIEKAGILMEKFTQLKGLDLNLNIIMGAMNLQNEKYNKAYKHLFTVLEEDWHNIHANILMSFMYTAINRPGLSRKHLAIAKV
jgi:Tfp pilus assembly protein PilF